MAAYYNENDPRAAAWLRELIRAGHIADGVVDDRSITDVQPQDLREFTQCHFFAGIGGWSYALRLAGWPDDRRVWTGSCPCQPFSAAGKQGGVRDPRHLWPELLRLVRGGQPATVFGEQVASAAGRDWLTGVRADLEALAYEVGAADLCAAGVGAPHIRQRLYWVADSGSTRRGQLQPDALSGGSVKTLSSRQEKSGRWSSLGGMADPNSKRLEECAVQLRQPEHRRTSVQCESTTSGDCEVGGLGHADEQGSQGWGARLIECLHQWPAGTANLAVLCTDGKARRFEPGAFPLAHGIPARMGRLRGYGNAIVPQVAAEFIAAYLEARP